MKLYSYVVTHDTGFAPNPFHGYCTLACCKPVIRRTIGEHFGPKEEYWIVGISPKAMGNRLVFVMRITEPPMLFGDYFNEKRFQIKKPKQRETKAGNGYDSESAGDNIYRLESDGSYSQLPFGLHGREDKEHDLSGKYVLISSDFHYFHFEPKVLTKLSKNLDALIVGRGHKCRFDEDVKGAFKKAAKVLENEPKVQNKKEPLPLSGKRLRDSNTGCTR